MWRLWLGLFFPMLSSCWVLNSGTCSPEPLSAGAKRLDPESLLFGYEGFDSDCRKVQGSYSVETLTLEEWLTRARQGKIWFSEVKSDLKSKNLELDNAIRISKPATARVSDYICRSQLNGEIGFAHCGSRAGVATVEVQGSSRSWLPAWANKLSEEYSNLTLSSEEPVRYYAPGGTDEISAPSLDTRPVNDDESCVVDSARTLSQQVVSCSGKRASELRSSLGEGLGFVRWRLVFRDRVLSLSDCSSLPCRTEVWLNNNTGQVWWIAGHSVLAGEPTPTAAVTRANMATGTSRYSCVTPNAGPDEEWRSLKGGLHSQSEKIRVRWRLPSRSETFAAFSDGFDILFASSGSHPDRSFWTFDFLGTMGITGNSFSIAGSSTGTTITTQLQVAVCIGSVDPGSW
jgi:hypothetical protein